jgi:hypothetical protein
LRTSEPEEDGGAQPLLDPIAALRGCAGLAHAVGRDIGAPVGVVGRRSIAVRLKARGTPRKLDVLTHRCVSLQAVFLCIASKRHGALFSDSSHVSKAEQDERNQDTEGVIRTNR